MKSIRKSIVNFTIELQNKDQTIKLIVKQGVQKPYLYKSKTTQLLKDMGEKDVVIVEGKGRGTKYIIK